VGGISLAGSRDHPRAPEQADQLPRSDDRPGRPDQPRVPDSPAKADRPDTPSPAPREQRPDRPRSAGDERRTRALEAFPPGHPSSPYQADGSRRPAERSLRTLELPLPDEWAEDWDTSTSASGKNADGDAGDANGQYAGTARRDGDRQGWDDWGGSAGRGDWNGDGSADRQADVGAPSRKTEGPGWSASELIEENRGQAGDIDDAFLPEETRRRQGTSDNTVGRTRDANAQTADAMSPPEGIHRNYWTEVPRFERMWGVHETKWPKETQPAARVDRSADPPGSWRSDSNLFLGPDNHNRTKEAISEVHGAESHVTEDLHRIKDESPHSAELVGLEFRRKGDARLKEKVAEVLVVAGPDATPEEVVRDIPDAIRYTFRISKEDYTSGCRDISRHMEERGYELYYSKNHWGDSGYKGINTRWLTPQGQRFEVQFHTPESHHAKQEVTHEAYERIRNPLTSDEERLALDEFQSEVCSWIPVPADVMSIPNYPKKGL
jgi:hypothetical protein